MQKCQKGGGFKMSKWCRCVKTLQVYFVKMVQVQKNCGGRRTRPHHNLHHTTNASLIIEHSKRVIKQSKDWLFATSDPNLYLREGHKSCKLASLALPDAFIRSLAAYIQSA